MPRKPALRLQRKSISTSSASTPSARCRWTRCRRPTPAIPGTPMALAPVAYTLWQQFLRYDPDDPIWPNRDRFVLSDGHASMLLYSLLHLAGVQAVNAEYERSASLRSARRHQAVPPARQQMPRPSRISPDHRRRDDHRPARAGLRQQRRHGDRRRAGWRRTSTGPASTCSTTTSTPSAATAT